MTKLLLVGLAIAFAIPPAGAEKPAAAAFPFHLTVEMGASRLAPGDSLTITEVRGTQPKIGIGGTYCVVGSYTLSSRDEAQLALFATVPNSGPTATDPRQVVRVAKGTGQFRLIKTVAQDGYLHLGLYPVSHGESFGTLYFGQGNWVLRDLGIVGEDTRLQKASGANAALYKFLGDPVPPPADLDPAYSRKGLFDAVTLAAKNAGVDLKTLTIDDSEFPYLVGVVSSSGDLNKLREQFKTMSAYHYSGSVSSSTCYAFNITPSGAIPPGFERRVHPRMALRMEMLFQKLQAGDDGP